MFIRREQMESLHEASALAFQDQMVAHARGFSPRLCEVIGEDPFHRAILQAIQRAKRYGLTTRGGVRLFIELTLLFGSGFDTDPQ